MSVSAVAGLHLGKLSTKSAQDYSESSIRASNCKKLVGSGHFWKMGSAKCAHDSEQCGKSTLLTLRECWLIWCSAPAICRFSAVCDTLAQLRAAKHEFCCDAPALRDCSFAKCIVTAARREELGCLQKS